MIQSGNSLKSISRKKCFIFFSCFLCVIFTIVFFYWYFVLSRQVSTDDAYVAGNIIGVSSQVGGSVTEINYTNTEYVRRGDILAKLDKTDSLIAFNQAKNNLANVVREIQKFYVLDAQYQANITEARIQYKLASDDYQRRVRLMGNGAISKQDLEHSKYSVLSAKASLDAAIQAYNANKVLIMNTPLERQPQVLQAADNMKQAWLALKRTDIRSPVSGYIAQRNVQVGESINPNQLLMAVVPSQQLWVKANFKETQLTNVHVGQKVILTSDLYGNSVIFHGFVKGITMGTGNAFSLLPAQNASGNWIKVVQRVPVEVVLNKEEIAKYPLRIGLSMNATIYTGEENNRHAPNISTLTSSSPAYASDALVINSQPVDDLIANIIKINRQQ
ncbi:efflux pump membrane protein [Enterobacter hormaechei]|uniref:EmrA/EmrK family multidrug efflux transporter periplasmic adaptor subunit n=1 Tax=Enterobacter hormaechei TaxID=158836 RepID=UPI0007993BFD|nr:EmrA/EmrK family multidrug efflux transporter periplasmic adaptor subunit [Enterobacter hormaechei]SAG78895.1 efflux pump membrane protein [Enterobacter hormaechei]